MMIEPTAIQVRTAASVVRWYLHFHYRSPDDSGVPAMFCDPTHVGAFAVDRKELRVGKGPTLFRLLVATAMFQRRQDVQILRILRGIGEADAAELTEVERLLHLVDLGRCAHVRTVDSLHHRCDLAKDPLTKVGCCTENPRVACHLKRHTVLLKRYGHFGKMPTSLALVLREAGVADLEQLRGEVLRRERDPLARAISLEVVLSRAWRVNQKIASMFLSAVSNPDMSRGGAPWAVGLDWAYFVVIDSNVDLFLATIGYRGRGSYDARRQFILALAERIDLRCLDHRLRCYNPRVVQQALYLFMSATNRRRARGDCMHVGRRACAKCPSTLTRRCPVRSA